MVVVVVMVVVGGGDNNGSSSGFFLHSDNITLIFTVATVNFPDSCILSDIEIRPGSKHQFTDIECFPTCGTYISYDTYSGII